MKFKLATLLLSLALVSSLLMLTPTVTAQETTPNQFPTAQPENPQATEEVVATEEVTAPVIINIEAPDEPTPAPVDYEQALNLWQIGAGLLAAFSLGGLVGFAAFGVLATRLRNDPATMKAIEALANSTPKHVTDGLMEIGKSAQAVGELLVEATDGIPAASK